MSESYIITDCRGSRDSAHRIARSCAYRVRVVVTRPRYFGLSWTFEIFDVLNRPELDGALDSAFASAKSRPGTVTIEALE